ncbi:MAG: hypothetical protein CMJ51_01690 [Planctomycetaceae bacterium]|nr:hypothetical protein [Planctomycetaceae bacterium]
MNTIWIFVAIAVIQFIFQGVAKASEKRKKALLKLEDAAKDPRQAVSSDPIPAADSRQKAIADSLKEALMQASGLSSPDGAKQSGEKAGITELRQRRIEALRRRKEVAAASMDPRRPQARPSGVGTEVSMAAVPPPPPPPPPIVVPGSGPSKPAVNRPVRRPARRLEAAPPAQTPARNRDARGTANRSIASAPVSAPGVDSKSNSGPQIGSRLRGRLRDPRSFREAFMLAELLQPPVALRKPAEPS